MSAGCASAWVSVRCDGCGPGGPAEHIALPALALTSLRPLAALVDASAAACACCGADARAGEVVLEVGGREHTLDGAGRVWDDGDALELAAWLRGVAPARRAA